MQSQIGTRSHDITPGDDELERAVSTSGDALDVLYHGTGRTHRRVVEPHNTVEGPAKNDITEFMEQGDCCLRDAEIVRHRVCLA